MINDIVLNVWSKIAITQLRIIESAWLVIAELLKNKR